MMFADFFVFRGTVVTDSERNNAENCHGRNKSGFWVLKSM